MIWLAQATETLFGVRNDLIVAGVLAGFFILAAVSAFAAQRWAQRCFQELKRLNENIEALRRENTGLAPTERPASYLEDEQQ